MKNAGRILKLSLALSLAGFVSPALSAEPQKSSVEIQIAKKALVWNGFNKGIRIAFAKGNAKTGPLSFFLRMRPGYRSGKHTHGGNYHGVVLEGTITNPVAGSSSAKRLAAGSYWFQPKAQIHETNCVSNNHCVVYIQQQMGLSFYPAK